MAMEALGLDISALSIGEMRRLIAQAQARGQTALARQLQSELAWRRGAERGPETPAWRADDSDDDSGPHAPSPAAAAWRWPARAWQLATAALAGAAVAGLTAWAM